MRIIVIESEKRFVDMDIQCCTVFYQLSLFIIPHRYRFLVKIKHLQKETIWIYLICIFICYILNLEDDRIEIPFQWNEFQFDLNWIWSFQINDISLFPFSSGSIMVVPNRYICWLHLLMKKERNREKKLLKLFSYSFMWVYECKNLTSFVFALKIAVCVSTNSVVSISSFLSIKIHCLFKFKFPLD